MLADSVGLALLVVLDTLAPAERVAFVLHDTFGLPFGQIAAITGRSPAAARQLASRARRRIQGTASVPRSRLARQREVADAFLAAARGGDLGALLAVLDPEVVLHADAAAVPSGAPATLRGAAAVARGARVASGRSRYSRVALVNGTPGIVMAPRGRLILVLALTIGDSTISRIDVIADPARLEKLDLAVLDADDAAQQGKVAVSAPGITFQLLDGPQAAAHADELQVLHAEVYADPPYGRDDATVFAERFRVQRRQPGFVLAEARHGGYLVGYASGMPLRPSTSWWRDLTTPLPADVTAEHPGRTFALVDLLVRASWRRQGIGRTLHDLILANRPRNARRSPSCLPPPRHRTPSPHGAGARSPAPVIPALAHRYRTCSSPRSRSDHVGERLAGGEAAQLRGDQPVRARGEG